MEKLKIRNNLFGLLMIGLLAGTAQEVFAQRAVAGNEVKRPVRTVKKEKVVKKSPRQPLRKSHTSKPVRAREAYQRKNNPKKPNRDYKKGGKSYSRNRNHAYKHRDKRRHIPTQRIRHHGPHHRPAWVDYHRRGYRYPRIGMHVSVLPFGHFSFVIGKLRFYTYRGIYYRYEPARRVYIVVNKPIIETRYTSATWDKIILMDGSTIEGVYHYSDNDTAFFEVGNAMLEIPMSEIKVLYLAEK